MNNSMINIIEKSFNENKNSHAFLMETNNLENCLNDIKKIIFEINNISKEVDLAKFPDIKLIIPDGKEIKRDQIKQIIDEFQTYPVELKHRYYIIVKSDAMNVSSANILLKFLEEPDNSVIGFFVTENKAGMINTIVSRCQYYKFLYDSELKINIEKIYDFLNSMNVLETYNKILFLNNFIKKDRIENVNLFREIKFHLLNNKSENIDEIKLLVKRINLLDNIIEKLMRNANQELVFLDLARNWK